MVLSYRDGIAIGELAFYCPAVLIGIYLTLIHPFYTTGWIDIAFFSLIRIVSSAIQLCTLSNPTSTNLYTISGILNSIGLAPLLAGSLGLVDRLNQNIEKNHRHSLIPKYLFRLAQLTIITGLMLGVVGGVNAGKEYGDTDQFTMDGVGKAGTGLMIGVFIADVIFTIFTAMQVSHIDAGQKRLLLAVASAIPFLLIRTVYAILATLCHNPQITLIGGNATDWLSLAVLEEYAVIIIYIAAGLSAGQVLNAR